MRCKDNEDEDDCDVDIEVDGSEDSSSNPLMPGEFLIIVILITRISSYNAQSTYKINVQVRFTSN